MVHGADSFSGGSKGADSFSGGSKGGSIDGSGFHTAGSKSNYMYYSGPRRSKKCSVCSTDCSGCKRCHPLFYNVCISLKPRQIMVFLWCLIVLLSLVIGLFVGLGTYGKRFTEASSSDIIQITSGISPRFCSGVEIKCFSYPLNVYVLSDKQIVYSEKLTSHNYSKYAVLPSYSHKHWGFYLLEKSSVKITVCSGDMGIDYYLIKGEHNLEKWKGDNYCSSCYEFHRGTDGCFFRMSTFTHDIYSSDEYYFVFANQFYHSSNVTITFQLRRASYDLSSAKHTCKNSHVCTINYSGEDSRESLVVVLPDIDVDDVDIGSICLRRDWVFVGLFFVMPLVIGFSITAVIYLLCIRKKGSEGSLENDPKVNSVFSTFQQPNAPDVLLPSPPLYDSLFLPPSYEDATKSV